MLPPPSSRSRFGASARRRGPVDSVRRRRWTSTVSLSSGPEPLEPDVSNRFKSLEPADLYLAETGDVALASPEPVSTGW